MKLGILYDRIRNDEKLLIECAKKRGIEVDLINDKDIIFRLEKNEFDYDIILERCINHARALYSLKILNEFGIKTINSGETAEICGSKFLVTEALLKNSVATPKVAVCFTKESAMKAVLEMGFPCVFKPAIGSWGTLLAKVNDIEAAEAIIDHKEKLGSYHHSTFYVQEYIAKPDRDIRAFVVGNEVAGAIYRTGKHWITHPNKGAIISKCCLTQDIIKIALCATMAVKGDIVAVDIIESEKGLLVLEVEYTLEFSEFFPDLDSNIVEKIIDYCIKLSGGKK